MSSKCKKPKRYRSNILKHEVCVLSTTGVVVILEMYAPTYPYMIHVYTYIYVCICVCIYVYIHVCKHTRKDTQDHMFAVCGPWTRRARLQVLRTCLQYIGQLPALISSLAAWKGYYTVLYYTSPRYYVLLYTILFYTILN